VVLVDAKQQAAKVTLAATLGKKTLTADVRVLGSAEVPKILKIEPAVAKVQPLKLLSLAVVLDIPAPPSTGSDVALLLAPGLAGSVPPSVNVPPDKLGATFDFTAGATEGLEQLSATLGASSAQASIQVVEMGGLVINEIDYDQPGTDADEYVELLNTKGTPFNCANHALVFVNGSTSQEYLRVDLSPAGMLGSGEYLVVGSPTALAQVPQGVKTIAFKTATNVIQNGAPDAVGLLDVTASKLLDALSYEGAVTAGVVKNAGTFSFVEGTMLPASVADNSTAPGSLGRFPNGSDTDDAATDWVFSATITPGVANK
jgi:hypothetical protein